MPVPYGAGGAAECRMRTEMNLNRNRYYRYVREL